ncbi:MAG: hypothetical protein H0V43_05525 [Gemmatimonadales bacterium]|nr:hypothetical protein [Gemmatimonadales bacterium]MBA3556194.1 hypothetical protein [Gemmatimonadales bacterium]
MFHSMSGTAVLTGLAAAALTLACSSTSDPTPDPSSPAAAARSAGTPTLKEQHSGTTNRLQAISPVSALVAWASGVGGTYTVTRNGGETWRVGVVPGAEALQFRDVEAVSGQEAYLLSAGTGEDARIYHTVDGGQTWKLQFKNHDPAAFYDCFAFWNPDRGVVMADAVDGRFPVRRTENGSFWRDIGDRLPAAQEGEAAFAASGTCVATQGKDRAWIATGGADRARILATTDGGDSWQAYRTPIVQGTPASGIFTVAFRDAQHGILAGGDLERPDTRSRNVAVSSDGGKTWTLAANAPFPGAVYGLSYAAGHDQGPANKRVVVTGPGGAAWSEDEGASWTRLRGVRDYWAVAFANRHVGWLVGTEGRILKITF